MKKADQLIGFLKSNFSVVCLVQASNDNYTLYYSAAATLRAGNFSLIRADLPERSRR